MAQKIGKVINLAKARTDSQLLSGKCRDAQKAVDALLASGLKTQEDYERLKSLALSLPSDHIPATIEQISRRLDWIAATLPRQKTDLESGQKRAVVYSQILHGYTDGALAYLVKRACRELDWFPTPRQCLEVLEGYSPPVTRKEKAFRFCEDWTQAIFDQFVADLRDGPVPQAQIDDKPERWKRMCWETGLLQRVGNGFVQRAKISTD